MIWAIAYIMLGKCEDHLTPDFISLCNTPNSWCTINFALMANNELKTKLKSRGSLAHSPSFGTDQNRSPFLHKYFSKSEKKKVNETDKTRFKKEKYAIKILT